MEVLTEVWARVTTRQPTPDAGVVVVAALVAVALVVPRPAWAWTRHLVTIAHEGSHGAAAVLTGRRLGGIRLHRDTSGLTLSRGRPRGPGMVLTAGAGYVGPALIGLAAAFALASGWAVAVLWALLLLLVLLLLQVRNLFGVVSVLATGAVVLGVSWWGTGTLQSTFAYVVVWFLLVATPRPVVELAAQRRRQATPGSDADQLAALTHVPGAVWTAFFLLVTLGALVLGGGALLGRGLLG
ncbi:M50 family metallopeptidase [Solicola sp. PLA-1-18]|uniref:M50 family metallopeptidase n=1 Tax=Solicola sp. PLA-1-18 TaxID=3380532 RepID=UPI003B7ADBAC